MALTGQLGTANSTLGNIALGVVPAVSLPLGISLVGSAFLDLVTGGTALGGTTPAVNTTGANLLVACIGWNNPAGGVVTLTDSKGNTWVPLTRRDGGVSSHRFYYVKAATVGTGHTFTVSMSANAWPGFMVYAFAGADTINPFDAQNGASGGNSGPLSTGSITPTRSGSVVISGLQHGNGTPSSATVTTGLSANLVKMETGAASYFVQSPAAAINPSWGFSGGNQSSVVAIASFLPPPVVGGVTVASTAVVNVPVIANTGSVVMPFRVSTAVLNVPLVTLDVVRPPFRASTAHLFTPAITFPGYLEDVRLECFAWGYTHTASVSLTLDPATLHSIAWGTEYGAIVDVVLDDATLFARIFQTTSARMNLGTNNATLTAHLHGGEVPLLAPRQGPRIYNVTGPVRATGGTILCFIGPPNKSIDWRILQGHGTLTPFTTFTDEQGRCSCRFDAAGITGKVVIGAAWVP